MGSAFEDFVNLEIPKRIATNDNPVTVPPGMVPVSTGIGLMTTFIELETGNKILTLTTESDLSGHRAIAITDLGFANYLSLDLWDRCIGISTHSALNGSTIKIQSTGEIVEPTWNWVVGQPIFAHEDGIISQTPSESFIVVIGKAISQTKILLNLETPIIL